MAQTKSVAKIAKLSPSMIDNINGGAKSRKSISVDFSKNRKVHEGGRNNTLAQIAGSLRVRNLEYKTIVHVLMNVNELECQPPLSPKEVRSIARSINRYSSPQEDAFINLADIEVEEVEFLIEPYLPLGSITILDGMMGQGKSTFTASLASMVTNGMPPPFAKDIRQGGVLFLSAEDDPSRVLKPRLVAAEANMELIRVQATPFALDERGLQMLETEITQYRPMLTVIDPIIAYMEGGTDSANSVDMTRFMSELDLMARKYNCAILLVRHLRKAKADSTMYQGLGSVAIIARVRSGLLLGRDPNDPDTRVIAHHKSNYAIEGKPIGFELISTPNSKYPIVKYVECDPNITAEDITRPMEKGVGRPDEQREFAKAFLREFLADRAQSKSAIDKAAKARGISEATLRRAADDLSVAKGSGRNSKWSLPE